MYCMNCGATVSPGSGFCMSCGAPVSEAAPDQQPMPSAPSMPPPGPYPAAPYPAPRPTGARNVAVLAVVTVLILFLVGGALAWLFIAGPQQTGACVEEWQYQSATRKENYTRAECDAFCASGVNPNHLRCYFDPY